MIIYYEDMPYGARIGGPMIVSTLAVEGLGSHCSVKVNIERTISLKVEDIRIYKSQIYPSDIENVVQYAHQLSDSAGSYERIWVSPH